MSQLTGLHAIFRKISIYVENMDFQHHLGRCLKPSTTDLVVIEGHLISQSHMDEVFRPVVLIFI